MGRALKATLLALVLLAGCARPAPPVPPAPVEPSPAQPGLQPPANVEAWLEYLTVEEKVGQLLWFGLEGAAPGGEASALVKEGRVGGFILFDRQGSDPVAIRRLTDQLQGLAQERDRWTPGLFLSVDEEGGKVERLGTALTPWPGAMAVGATRSEANADAIARAMARELLSLGININLAPIADVNSNPANPVIGSRSFGEEPDLVASMVAATIRGFHAEGLGSVAKHFPGHGDTHLDSHLALPEVRHSMDRLERVELVPFQAAISGGVDAIMAAHVIFPAVEPDELPSTLSGEVLQGLLKERMGFEGLVVTDAIDTMKAITDHFGTEEALVKAVQAGADVVLITESFGRQAALHETLLAAVQDGRIPADRLDDAVRRNLTAKARLGLVPGLSEARPAPPAPDQGREAHRELSFQVGLDALTLVRNADLPLSLTAEERVLVVSPTDASEFTGTDGTVSWLGKGLLRFHDHVVEVPVSRTPTTYEADTVRHRAGEAAAIVYGVANIGGSVGQQALLQDLLATGKPVILVGLGEPYDLTVMPKVRTYIAAYGDGPPNLQGVGALLFGRAPRGKLPVSIPDLYSVGHGLSF